MNVEELEEDILTLNLNSNDVSVPSSSGTASIIIH
jgi:hypothetical protein